LLIHPFEHQRNSLPVLRLCRMHFHADNQSRAYRSRYASCAHLLSSRRHNHAPPFLTRFHGLAIDNHGTWGWFSPQTASQAFS
jgi:hypothetical protein